ncbi:hypothetical protein LP421_30820 (plasmid) [Rhizobium sp. RCAM05350]|nr:hypothetical protein LP421_30820 [Rhizobium sp. RCAM05350]
MTASIALQRVRRNSEPNYRTLSAATTPGGRLPFTVFADLTAELIDDLYRPEFSKAADVMREVAYQILALGPGDELFGPVPHRRFHTVKTAAREFEIPVSILNAAIRAVKNVNQNRPNLPMLYDKSVFEKVVSSLRRAAPSEVSRFMDMMERERIGESAVATRPGESLPLEIAVGELRTTTDALWSLADEGFLAIFPASKPKPHWRISKSDVVEFHERYMSGIELRHMLRRWKNSSEPRSEQDFAPVMCRSMVGENFYSRPEIV